MAGRAPKPPGPGLVTTTVRFPAELYERVYDATRRRGESINAWVMRAVERQLQYEERAPRAGRGEGGG